VISSQNYFEKIVQIVMVNNSTNINKITDYKKKNIRRWKSRSWFGIGKKM